MVGQLALSIGCSSFNLSPTFIHFHPQHCSAVTAWQSGSAHFAVHSFVKILLIALSQLKQAASWTLVSILWCDNCQQNCGEYLCNILCRNLCNIVEKISAAFCGENLCSTVEKIHVLAAGGIATWIGAASTFKRRFVCTFWAVFGKNPPKSATYFFFGKKIIRSWYRMILPLELVMPVAIGADGNIFGGIELVKRTKCTKTFRSSLLSGSGWDPVILPLELAALSGGTNLRVGRPFQLPNLVPCLVEKMWTESAVKQNPTCESVLCHQDYHHLRSLATSATERRIATWTWTYLQKSAQ